MRLIDSLLSVPARDPEGLRPARSGFLVAGRENREVAQRRAAQRDGLGPDQVHAGARHASCLIKRSSVAPSPQEAVVMAQSTLTANRVRPYLERQETQASRINVGDIERWTSLIGGGALALLGLSRRSLGGLGLAALGGALAYRGATGHCPMYGALGFSTAERRGPVTSIPAGHGVRVETSVTINRPREELYQFWRSLDNLPRIMRHLKSVRIVSPTRSHWIAKGPMGTSFEWEAEIHTERPNELISWRSLPDAQVDMAGSVHFLPTPGGLGTELRVLLKYDPPAGKIGAEVAKLLGDGPEEEIAEDLRRFKRALEAGGI
jgi:uncharacterized membrane protein